MNRAVKNTIVGLFAAGVVAVMVLLVRDGEFVFASLWALAVLAPTIAFLLGTRWCGWVVAGFSVVILIFWTLLPAMQHGIDRHLGFWSGWCIIEGLLAATIWVALTSLKAPKREEPAASAKPR
jgi:hypothetical protein